MGFITGMDIGSQICAALGINPDGVKSLTLNVKYNEAVSVTIEKLVDEEEAKQLVGWMGGYKAIAKTESHMLLLVEEEELLSREDCLKILGLEITQEEGQ